MLEKLNNLLSKKKINKAQYDLFVLFASTSGSEFLNTKLMNAAMEESPTVTNDGFAWADGRRSVWRDIKNTLTYIHNLLEKNSGNHE